MNPEAIQSAATTLRQALAEKGIGVSDDKVQWLLGQVMGESAFGTANDWTVPNSVDPGGRGNDGPSNNWGAVRKYGDGPYVLHQDRDAAGNLGTYKFAWYATPLDGAKAYLSALIRSDISAAVANVLANPSSSPADLARAMYTRDPDPGVTKRSSMAYYTGTTGTDADRINAYANMIASGANRARVALGLPANASAGEKVVQGAGTPATSMGWVGKIIAGGALALGGYTAWRWYRGRSQ